MSRHTYCVPAAYTHDRDFQKDLNYLWRLIENKYEEDWRVAFNGDLILQVDEAFMERVLRDNPAEASLYFGAHEEHNPENERYEWSDFPEHLEGEYIITGVYDVSQRLVNGNRSYYFVQA